MPPLFSLPISRREKCLMVVVKDDETRKGPPGALWLQARQTVQSRSR